MHSKPPMQSIRNQEKQISLFYNKILTFYDSTKEGVDVADEYKARYSVSRTSNRWPVTLYCLTFILTRATTPVAFHSATPPGLGMQAWLHKIKNYRWILNIDLPYR